jgi:branched-chain amino acid transport system permease protein
MQYLLNGLPIGAIYALVALSYSLIYTTSGVLNWSQGDMVMLGAYIGFALFQLWHVGFTAGLLVSMLVVGVIGVIVQYCILRPLRERQAPPINVVIATLGVAIVARNIALAVWGPEAQIYPSPVSADPFALGVLSITPQDLLIVFTAIGLMLVLQYLLRRTKEGKALRAVAQDRYAAVLMGVDTEKSDAVAFATSAALGAAAGILVAPVFFVTFNMGAGIGLKGFVAAVIGGLGNIPGAIAGGFFLGLVESLAGGQISSGYRDAITFGLLIMVLWLRPSGLFLRKSRQKV